MSLVTLPFSFTAHTRAIASQVNANFAALVAALNGALSDVNFSATADLDANKFSSSPGKRVPNAKMESNAVDARVLASDSGTPGSDSLRAVSGDHMKALTVAQVARIVPASGITNSMLAGPLASLLANGSIASEKLKLTVHTVTPVSSGALADGFFADITANPTSTFAVATYDLIGFYMLNATFNDDWEISPYVTNTTNWGGRVRFHNSSGGSASTTVSLVYVFLQKN